MSELEIPSIHARTDRDTTETEPGLAGQRQSPVGALGLARELHPSLQLLIAFMVCAVLGAAGAAFSRATSYIWPGGQQSPILNGAATGGGTNVIEPSAYNRFPGAASGWEPAFDPATLTLGTGISTPESATGRTYRAAEQVNGAVGPTGVGGTTAGGRQTPAKLSITQCGASTASADNTAAIQACVNQAFAAGEAVYIPPGKWRIAGTIVVGQTLAPGGFGGYLFGVEGPGMLLETSNNLPVFDFNANGGFIESMHMDHLYILYQNQQTSAQPDSACFRMDLGNKGASLFNSYFNDIDCQQSFRGFDGISASPSPGSYWGNRMTNFRCKGDFGACLIFYDAGAGSPNNYFGNIYTINSECQGTDIYQFEFEGMTQLTLENFEANQTPCGLIATARNRNVAMRNIRDEFGTVGPKFAGHGLIETAGDGVTVDGFEVQNITNNTGGRMYLYRDAGTAGPPDTVSRIAMYMDTTPRANGQTYGVSSTSIPVRLNPVTGWYVTASNYSADIAPESTSFVTDQPSNAPLPALAVAAGAGWGAAISKDPTCSGLDCVVTLQTGSSGLASGAVLTVTWPLVGRRFNVWKVAPHCIFSPASASAAGASNQLFGGASGGGESTLARWTLSTTTALAPSTSYSFSLKCGG